MARPASATTPSEGERFELPGLWLNSEELHALLAAQQLLSRSGGGMLSTALAPLQQRIEKLLDEHAGGKRWPVERVRVIPHRTAQAGRACVPQRSPPRCWSASSSRSTTARAPPTRRPGARCRRSALTHYRDNWYLDAWDHEREALRSFSVDRISTRAAARRRRARRGRDELDQPPGRQLRHLLRRAEGLGDDPVQRQGRALGRRRALAFAAAGPLPARRPLRAEGAVQRRRANC